MIKKLTPLTIMDNNGSMQLRLSALDKYRLNRLVFVKLVEYMVYRVSKPFVSEITKLKGRRCSQKSIFYKYTSFAFNNMAI